MTLLYRAGVDPLKAMKIVGHSEYQTTADIYTHLDQEMMQATADRPRARTTAPRDSTSVQATR